MGDGECMLHHTKELDAIVRSTGTARSCRTRTNFTSFRNALSGAPCAGTRHVRRPRHAYPQGTSQLKHLQGKEGHR